MGKKCDISEYLKEWFKSSVSLQYKIFYGVNEIADPEVSPTVLDRPNLLKLHILPDIFGWFQLWFKFCLASNENIEDKKHNNLVIDTGK